MDHPKYLTTYGTENTHLTNKRITYEELKKHASYTDAWIAINGIVYDITVFIDNHPFGDTFRGNLGIDCSGLFSSAHINTNVEALLESDDFLEENQIRVVGQLDVSRDHLYKNNNDRFLDRIVYKETYNDNFWLELNTRVKTHIQDNNIATHYTFLEGSMYILYYFVIFLLLSYLTWIEGSLISSILLGFHMVCAATNVSHMATHHGFTRNSLLNFTAEHFFDLGGLSWLEWKIIHQTHHNQPHSSIDYQTNQYVIRIHRYMEHKSYHRYQPTYFWITVAFYHLTNLPLTTIWLFENKEFVRHKYEIAAHILARSILLIPIFYCAFINGYWTAIILFLLYSLSYSYTAFILLNNDHEDTHNVLGLKKDVRNYHNKISWSEVQVKTSNNWYPTNLLLTFIQFHYGYFNFHIEHHLFPSFKPSLCKDISSIVREVCERHNIPYILTTFIKVQASYQKHITKLSLPPLNK